jgi:hypothetical protein
VLKINNEAIEAVNNGTDIPNFLFDDDGKKAFHLRYKHTDGWRGYHYVTATKQGGWKKIDYDGWVTGNWNDAPEEARQDNVDTKLKALAKEYAKQGKDVIAIFAPTSNVFSTAFDVFVK